MSVQRDIDAELRFHLDARIEALVEQGMTRDAARAQALAEFGDVAATRETLRAIDRRVAKRRGRLELLEALRTDMAYAARSLRRTPVVSLTIALTLALGIGANVAMFSVLDMIYLRPPTGVAQPTPIRRVWSEEHFAAAREFQSGFDYSQFAAIQKAVGDRADAVVFSFGWKHRIGRGETAPTASVVGTMAGYFSFLGVRPSIGRFYSADESPLSGAPPVAVISDALWHRQFAGDSAIIGRPIDLGPYRFTIIGVAAPGFRGTELEAADVWMPLFQWVEIQGRRWDIGWWQNPNINGMSVLLRLRGEANEAELIRRMSHALRAPGVGFKQDTAAVAALGAINHARGPGATTSEVQVATRLAGVAVIVLLIACANVVNLLLARAVSRKREIAVRLALGISRSRLVRLFVAESLLLAVVAAVAAIGGAVWGSSALRSLLMPNVEWAAGTLHWRLLAFALAVALIAGTLAGLLPALRASRPDVVEDLKAGTAGAGSARSRLRATLVMAQAALSVVLLVGAVLFVRSLQNAKARDVGFAVNRLGFARVEYETRDSIRDARKSERLRALAPRIAAMPAVEGVAFTTMQPKNGMSFTAFFIDGKTKKQAGIYTAVTPNFFAVTGMRIVQGRTFDASVDASAPPSVVVNRAMADALWPNESPLGHCIRFKQATAPCVTVIGVAQTAILGDLREVPRPQMYVPLDNAPFWTGGASVAIVRADPSRLSAVQVGIRDLLRAEFPGGIPALRTMREAMQRDYRSWDLGAKLFALFGGLALLVAAIGVYSTVSYGVSQRTHEFGVRIALGARALDVLRQVLGEGLRTIVLGIVAGILMTLAAGKLVASLLYGIAPNDLVSIATVAITLILIALIAALRPAWRASRADPVSALRAD